MGSRQRREGLQMAQMFAQKRFLKSQLETRASGETWVGWFSRVIRELGGNYKVWRDMSGGAAKITGRRLMQRHIPFVKEFSSTGKAKAAVSMLAHAEDKAFGTKGEMTPKQRNELAAQRRELQRSYYRDIHGSLRRVLAK
jgi:hypothetical protein